jgi:hypothetical protein
MKYLITSVPKSGTYLTANIFKNLGISDSGIHIQNATKSLYIVGGWRQDKNNKNYNERVYKNSEDIIDEVKDGEFLTGHIEKTELMTKKFLGYKKVLLVRDMSGIIDSAIRYKKDQNVNLLPHINIEKFKSIEEWKNDSDCFTINFVDLIAKNIDVMNDLQIYLFGEVRLDSLEIIELSLKQDSPTKSNLRKDISHEK